MKYQLTDKSRENYICQKSYSASKYKNSELYNHLT